VGIGVKVAAHNQAKGEITNKAMEFLTKGLSDQVTISMIQLYFSS